MYDMLEREAGTAGLPLRWPPRLPNTRRALAAAEWARRYQPDAFPHFHRALFRAHFALGEDLEDPAIVDRHARDAGVDLDALHRALADGSAGAAVLEAEDLGRRSGVQGTPAWLLGERLIVGAATGSGIRTACGRRARDQEGHSMASPLADQELKLLHAYRRAANYLSVGQIYLLNTSSPDCSVTGARLRA
jgi:predicted DsbA family dithiol-disulfide isomerase